jgi:hypothetical protein
VAVSLEEEDGKGEEEIDLPYRQANLSVAELASTNETANPKHRYQQRSLHCISHFRSFSLANATVDLNSRSNLS